jgi:hypothetical protein
MELRRNAATRAGKLDYRASVAQWKAERFAQRPKTAKLVLNERLHQYAQDKLAGAVRAPDGRIVASRSHPAAACSCPSTPAPHAHHLLIEINHEGPEHVRVQSGAVNRPVPCEHKGIRRS